MAISKKNLALGALIAAGLGAFGTYPFARENICINFLHHGFLAAAVGGAADWFGITALFHKPMGIGYHTDVLIKNRKRIEEDLSAFICNDLLSVENILDAIKDEPIVQPIIDHLKDQEGKAALKKVLEPLIANFFTKLDLSSLEKLAANEVPKAVEGLGISKHVLDLAEQIVREEYLNESIDLVLLNLKNYVAQDWTLHKIVRNLLARAKQKYNDDGWLRSCIETISVEETTDKSLTAAQNYLEALRNPEHEQRIKFKQLLLNKIEEARANEIFTAKLNQFVSNLSISRLALSREILTHKTPEEMYLFLEAKLYETDKNEFVKAELEEIAREGLQKFLNAKHNALLKLVSEKLASYSDEELVQNIEGKVGDDLQMIRLNGTLVGGVVGMVLFAITLAAERRWG